MFNNIHQFLKRLLDFHDSTFLFLNENQEEVKEVK